MRVESEGKLAKIAIIGAGGYVFPLRLVGDILSHPELHDTTLALMDIDPGRLESTASAARALVASHCLPTRIEATTDRRRALDGADYVIVTFQIGGLEAYRYDVQIPRRYGVDQTVGDTLGPGGVFRFLRTAPVMREIVTDLREVAPDALLINYANPMSMLCWYLDRLGQKTVGLCHSIQAGSRLLARQVDVPYDEVQFLAAGINHCAWFLRFQHGQHDLYPEIRRVMEVRYGADGDRQRANIGPDPEATLYEGRMERVRTEMMAAFGYFHTESSHHSSEYVPYFRKNAALVAEYLPERWDYYERCASHDDTGHTESLLAELTSELKPSHEYGATLIRALETGEPSVIYGNVPNRGVITNLPEGCCVEVPCHVDSTGVRPFAVGALPPQCAALNRAMINVQELAVEAALTRNREHVYHAIMLDPLTATVLTLPQVRAMVDDLFAAEAAWLPEFSLAAI
ncbi:MAG: alpha-glucosidase/alpha-galactosidase [Thermomicrobiales bacterium]|nr:alpha-glucosidase/alpha-galactosidase [Thermomicrobiales bacterium]